MIVEVENPKESMGKLLKLMSLARLVDNSLIYKNQHLENSI